MKYLNILFSCLLFTASLCVLPAAGLWGIEAEQVKLSNELRQAYRNLYPLYDENKIQAMTIDIACSRLESDFKPFCEQNQKLEEQKRTTVTPLIFVFVFPFALVFGRLLCRLSAHEFPLIFSRTHDFLLIFFCFFLCVEVVITAQSVALVASSLSPSFVWWCAAATVTLIIALGFVMRYAYRYTAKKVYGNYLFKDQDNYLWEMVHSVAQRVKCDVPEHIIVGKSVNFFIDVASYIYDGKRRCGRVLYCSEQILEQLSRQEIYALIYREMRNYKLPVTANMTILKGRFEALSLCMHPASRVMMFLVEIGPLLMFFPLNYMCCSLFKSRHLVYEKSREYIADMSSCTHTGAEFVVQALIKVRYLKNAERHTSISAPIELEDFLHTDDTIQDEKFYNRLDRLPVNWVNINIKMHNFNYHSYNG